VFRGRMEEEEKVDGSSKIKGKNTESLLEEEEGQVGKKKEERFSPRGKEKIPTLRNPRIAIN